MGGAEEDEGWVLAWRGCGLARWEIAGCGGFDCGLNHCLIEGWTMDDGERSGEIAIVMVC